MKGDATFPPVDVFFDGVAYWLADGFHRYWALAKLGRPSIEAEIKHGTQRDAVLFSVGANSAHGQRRTNEDKRRAVMTMLNDEEWAGWSDSDIARECKVTQPFVGKLRSSLITVISEKPAPHGRTYTTKHGTKATMKTEKIGRGRKSQPAKISPQARQPCRQPEAARGMVAARIANLELGDNQHKRQGRSIDRPSATVSQQQAAHLPNGWATATWLPSSCP